eukprot:4601613-Prymnesium_polylepis.1
MQRPGRPAARAAAARGPTTYAVRNVPAACMWSACMQRSSVMAYVAYDAPGGGSGRYAHPAVP